MDTGCCWKWLCGQLLWKMGAAVMEATSREANIRKLIAMGANSNEVIGMQDPCYVDFLSEFSVF